MILPWLEIPFKSDIFLADQFSHIEKPSQSSRIKKKKSHVLFLYDNLSVSLPMSLKFYIAPILSFYLKFR